MIVRLVLREIVPIIDCGPAFLEARTVGMLVAIITVIMCDSQVAASCFVVCLFNLVLVDQATIFGSPGAVDREVLRVRQRGCVEEVGKPRSDEEYLRYLMELLGWSCLALHVAWYCLQLAQKYNGRICWRSCYDVTIYE